MSDGETAHKCVLCEDLKAGAMREFEPDGTSGERRVPRGGVDGFERQREDR